MAAGGGVCCASHHSLFGNVFVVVVEKSDAAPAALQLSMPVTTVAPLQRQISPGTVVNLSQRTHSASLTGVAPSPLVNVFSGTTSSVTGPGSVGRPVSAVTSTHATVLHTIRPVVTQAITVRILKHLSSAIYLLLNIIIYCCIIIPSPKIVWLEAFCFVLFVRASVCVS